MVRVHGMLVKADGEWVKTIGRKMKVHGEWAKVHGGRVSQKKCQREVQTGISGI